VSGPRIWAGFHLRRADLLRAADRGGIISLHIPATISV